MVVFGIAGGFNGLDVFCFGAGAADPPGASPSTFFFCVSLSLPGLMGVETGDASDAAGGAVVVAVGVIGRISGLVGKDVTEVSALRALSFAAGSVRMGVSALL